VYQVTKTFGHDFGLSCAFRQYRAESHCRFLHGYALAVSLTFRTEHLDQRNWVIDFGGFSQIKDFLKDTFDHKLLVAQDDPMLPIFEALEGGTYIGKDNVVAWRDAPQAANIVVVPATGCEAFAELISRWVFPWLYQQPCGDRVRLYSVEVREHNGNSATFFTGGA
jgi:6-pyruvoyltetrahydropterin/6-carboxytetrahydropterin synthase